MPRIIYSQAQLYRLVYLLPTTQAILFIAPPKMDRLRCNTCSYIAQTAQGIQAHCQERHRWYNDWQRGRSVAKRAKQEHRLLQTASICYQRFFLLRVGSRWFEVSQGSAREGAANREVKTLDRQLEQMYSIQVVRFQARKQVIKGADNKAEPNAQLQQAGQAKHLAGLDCSQLGRLVEAIRLDKAALQAMQESVEQVVEQAQAVVLKCSRYAVLFKINKKEVQVKLGRLFKGQIEDNIQASYKEVYQKLLYFLYQTQDQDNANQLLYMFIEKQGDLFNAFIDIVNKQVQDKDIGRISKAERQAQEGWVDWLYLDAIVAFFDYQYQDMLYKSVLISRLAVLEICKDSRQVGLGEYIPKYLAIIKIVYILVVYQSIVE